VRVLLALAGLAFATGCPGEDGNAPVLFLAPDGSELVVRLAEEPPPPY
jgi:hypothetical protein